MNREEAGAAVPTPASISAALRGYEWTRDTVGESGGAVYRLHGRADAPNLFLKYGKDAFADDVTPRENQQDRFLPRLCKTQGRVHADDTPPLDHVQNLSSINGEFVA